MISLGIFAILLLVAAFGCYSLKMDWWFVVLDIIATFMLIVYSISEGDVIYIIANLMILIFLLYRYWQDWGKKGLKEPWKFQPVKYIRVKISGK